MATWAIDRGYDDRQLAALEAALGSLVRSPWYREAMAADLSERHDADGRPVGHVSELDRHSAALMLHRHALRKAGPAVAPARGRRRGRRPLHRLTTRRRGLGRPGARF